MSPQDRVREKTVGKKGVMCLCVYTYICICAYMYVHIHVYMCLYEKL